MDIRKAVTLIEILIVTIIIGILAGLSLPLFEKTRERALDNEAKANVKLIQSAQKIYMMEYGDFAECSDVDAINIILRLNLPTGTRRIWNYTTTKVGNFDFLVNAIRRTVNINWLRTWSINATAEEPSCTGNGCP